MEAIDGPSIPERREQFMRRWFISCVLGLAACAPVKIYSHDGQAVKIGLPVSIPEYRTFLLTHGGADDPSKLETSVITLPVHSCKNTYYLKPRGSWGAAKLGFELDSGRLEAFNAESDGKGAETLSGIGELLTAAAGMAGAKAADEPAAALTDEELKGAMGTGTNVTPEQFRDLVDDLRMRGFNQATLRQSDVPTNYEKLDLVFLRRQLPPPPFILQEVRVSEQGRVTLLGLPSVLAEDPEAACERIITPGGGAR